MSRIGKLPIPLASNVTVTVTKGEVRVKGPKGELSRPMLRNLEVSSDGKEVLVKRKSDSGETRAMHGLMRTLIANMVSGVTNGFTKELEIEGVGFRAQAKGSELTLALGFSHDVVYPVPKGITVKTPKQTSIFIEGIDKELVGAVAARIRAFYKPEPYRGKGIRYVGETIRRKAGKSAVKGGG